MILFLKHFFPNLLTKASKFLLIKCDCLFEEWVRKNFQLSKVKGTEHNLTCKLEGHSN